MPAHFIALIDSPQTVAPALPVIALPIAALETFSALIPAKEKKRLHEPVVES